MCVLTLVSLPQICEAVLISGEGQSQRFRCQDQSPLMYEWYQEQYVGPAHGLAGIYYFLMQVIKLEPIGSIFPLFPCRQS
jgi:hypothetical protein